MNQTLKESFQLQLVTIKIRNWKKYRPLTGILYVPLVSHQ